MLNYRVLRIFVKRNIFCKRFLICTFFLSSFFMFFIIGNIFTIIRMPVNEFCTLEQCSLKFQQADTEIANNNWMGKWHKDYQAKGKTVFLLILIISAPNNFEQREVVRQTWLTDELHDTMHYFIVGTGSLTLETNITIQSEQKKFGDLLFLQNIYDSYDALTQKILTALVFIHLNVKFRYLLKVDDDSYVNLSQLHLELEEITFKQRLYWGFFDGRASPKRSGPWKETGWLLCDHYLPYALGGGYILSSDLVSYIASNAKYFKLYNSEDVSIGTWLAPLDIHRVHDPRFDTEYASRGCHNKYIISHKQSTIHMRDKFNSLKNTGYLCKKEFKVRKSYVYNWNVAPSKCCLRNDSTIP